MKLKKGEYPYYVSFAVLRKAGACASGAVDAMKELLRLDGQKPARNAEDFMKQRVYLSADLLKRARSNRTWWIAQRLRIAGLLTTDEWQRYSSVYASPSKANPLIDAFLPKLVKRRKNYKYKPRFVYGDNQLMADLRYALNSTF